MPWQRIWSAIATHAFVTATIVSFWMAPAGAHSSIIGASPAPDATAGGTIDSVELAFDEPVSDAVMSVFFNQEPLAGTTTAADGKIIRFDLAEALTVPGRYEVTFELISFDKDRTTNAYFFTYDPGAPPPAAVGESDVASLTTDESGGMDAFFLAGMAILSLILISLLAMFAWRLDAKRRHETTL